ncbi:DUF1266 domain-containing protein [Brachybacterium hainanense]|uniref:DUF1266 domain-containing protein n=1 Tax=Brachybacterium hainanense TaxID=1541174 RepID=A0ABV6RBN7_9MICO
MPHPLQNHPGSASRREFPVRATMRNLQLDRRYGGRMYTAVVTWALLGVLILVFLGRMEVGPLVRLREAGWDLGTVLSSTAPGMLLFWVIALAAGLGCLVLAVQLVRGARLRPLREQHRYYRIRGLAAPDDRLRRALRIGGHWMHQRSAWPLTIEVFPTSAGMTPRQVRSFRTLPLETPESERDGLAEDWGILDAQQARAMIDQYLQAGVHSYALAATLAGGDLEELEATAALADVPLSRLLELGETRDGHPPQLLWGWDLVRTAIIVRFSVIGGYLGREEGIDRLEEITDLAAALFPTEQELVENCEIGFALWAGTGGRAELRQRRAADAEYLAGEWPCALGPWPRPSGRPLPQAMADGFASLLREDEGEPR